MDADEERVRRLLVENERLRSMGRTFVVLAVGLAMGWLAACIWHDLPMPWQ